MLQRALKHGFNQPIRSNLDLASSFVPSRGIRRFMFGNSNITVDDTNTDDPLCWNFPPGMTASSSYNEKLNTSTSSLSRGKRKAHSRVNVKKRNELKKSIPCRNFFGPLHHCKYGDNCLFSHATPHSGGPLSYRGRGRDAHSEGRGRGGRSFHGREGGRSLSIYRGGCGEGRGGSHGPPRDSCGRGDGRFPMSGRGRGHGDVNEKERRRSDDGDERGGVVGIGKRSTRIHLPSSTSVNNSPIRKKKKEDNVPTMSEPTIKPTTPKPTMFEPTTSEPTTKPMTPKSTTSEPTTKPTMFEPTTSEPTTKPMTPKPTIVNDSPSTWNPDGGDVSSSSSKSSSHSTNDNNKTMKIMSLRRKANPPSAENK